MQHKQISALSSIKIDKYEYQTGEQILPAQQHRIIEKSKISYSPIKKAMEKKQKQLKRMEKYKLKH